MVTIAIEQHRQMWTERRKTKVKKLCNVSVWWFILFPWELSYVYFVSLNHENSVEFWPAFKKRKPLSEIKIEQFHEILSDYISYFLFKAQNVRICTYINICTYCLRWGYFPMFTNANHPIRCFLYPSKLTFHEKLAV